MHTGPHDLGGVTDPPLAPLDLQARPYAFWERETHGCVWLLVQKGLMSLDELRRATEQLPAYEQLSYYEKWAGASTAIAIERGTFSRAELDAALGPDPSTLDNSIRFKQGDCVRVCSEDASIRWRRPHLRTPGYIFGQVGVIERVCGLFGNPELKAFREEGRPQPLYRVRFFQSDVWELYTGDASDTVDVEIYQPWLQPATPEQLQAQREAAAAVRATHHAAAHHHSHEHSHHEHEHTHEHEHEHEAAEASAGEGEGGQPAAAKQHKPGVIDHGDHTHEERQQVEENAVSQEGDDGARPRLPEVLKRLLISKGIITPEELRREVEVMDARGTRGEGQRLVARCWVDPAFKQRLLQDTAAAAAELGISTSNFPPKPTEAGAPGAAAEAAAAAPPGPKSGTVLTAVENTSSVHNLVVCTLCSCYPISVLGMSPPWYRSRSYRARAVRNPRGLLAEFGTMLPPGTTIRVHDSTADLRYIVIPARPPGTDGWTEEQLAQLVTRDSMIGVAPALLPEQLAAGGR